MSITTTVNAYGSYCKFGVDWQAVDGDGTLKITPKVYRYDLYSTQDSSSWTEKLITEPDGSTGTFSIDGYGVQPSTSDSWRIIDTFNVARTYSKTHSTKTVKIRIITADGFGTWIPGEDFHYIGANTYDLSYTITARTSYTVSYNANGGSGAPSSQTKWYDETLALSTTKPSRTGYAFAGWATSSSANTASYQPGGSFTTNADTTLYAVWNPIVSYDKNTTASVGNMPASQTKTRGTNLTLSTAVPTRTGYTFSKWNTKADGTGSNFSPGSTYTGNNALTLYAQWTIDTYQVTYNANGGSGTVSAQTKTYGTPLTLASSGFTKSYYTLDGWATSASGGVAYELGASYASNAAITLYAHWKVNAPSNPSNVTATRNSDSKATVSWTRGSGANTTYERIYVGRATDANDFGSIGYVDGTATSFADTTISANHQYRYRIRAWNSTGYSDIVPEDGTDPIYTTPAAPSSVTGERSGNGTSVVLTVGNSGTRTATGFDVQYRASDSSTWSTATVASSTGTPVTSITIDDMGGSFYFRVRNKRTSPTTLTSAWTESDLVTTLTAPNAPTLISPASGAVIGSTSSTQSVTFEWQHNPVDGSAQTAATIRYKKSTASSWSSTTATTAQAKSITLDVGYSYVWQVRTKGAADSYGPYSNSQTFDLFAPPTISITSPSGTLTDMPINYSVSYLDNHGQFASGTIKVKLGSSTKYSEKLPATSTTPGTASNITGTITTTEFLPSSGKTYTLEVTAKSSDTLSTTATASMPVSMGEPNHGTLSVTNDPDTGYAMLTIGWDTETGDVSATSASLYRVVGDERLLLAEGLTQESGYTDKYAPLNTEYHYEVVTHASSNAVAVEEFDNLIASQRWFVYWGDDYAWAEWNPQGSYKLTRPDKKRVHYVGREYPVSYDGTSLDETHTIQFTVLEMHEWANGFVKLMHDGGRGVYKSVDGKVFRADFELTNTPNYTSITKMGTVALTIYRIDGDAL